jgi:phage shock protein PspC (stress-responsive transcriptional regulator)
MNEVTKIHLSRQAFTISSDAYHELRTYIDAISRHVKDADVMDEIELRMTELLTEKGIDSNKVILPVDVEYLKSQLGDAKDFAEDGLDNETEQTETKRLFRDTDNAIIAGVAAGLAKYFGLDAVLVRLLFVLLVIFTVGWGLLLYILLWLLVPEAKTPSDRLQMAGRPVNVNSLKEVAEQADVRGAANRINRSLAEPVNKIFRFILKAAGIVLSAFGLAIIFGLIAALTYFLARGSEWAKNNIFPVGVTEHGLLYIAIAITALLAVFVILIGIAIYRRRWPIKTWVTGVLAGLVLIGFAVGGALAADVYPSVRDAYNANTHTTVRSVKQFSNVTIQASWLDSVNFVESDKYLVGFNYYGHPDLSQIKTSVNNGTLLIDGSTFNDRRDCNTICIPAFYRVSITIYSPNASQLENLPVFGPVPAPPSPASPMPKPFTE